jgi:hypothetical protein
MLLSIWVRWLRSRVDAIRIRQYDFVDDLSLSAVWAIMLKNFIRDPTYIMNPSAAVECLPLEGMVAIFTSESVGHGLSPYVA